MTTLPILLLALFPFVIIDNDYALILCTLFKSNALWNIFLKNRTRGCVVYNNDNSGFLTFGVTSFFFFLAHLSTKCSR